MDNPAYVAFGLATQAVGNMDNILANENNAGLAFDSFANDATLDFGLKNG